LFQVDVSQKYTSWNIHSTPYHHQIVELKTNNNNTVQQGNNNVLEMTETSNKSDARIKSSKPTTATPKIVQACASNNGLELYTYYASMKAVHDNIPAPSSFQTHLSPNAKLLKRSSKPP
jgi:hypothetical protein